MKFESEKLSIRVQDGLTYNAILSEVYYIVYDKFISFLPFLEEINQSENFIKKESIKELNNKKIPEKILSIYANNADFFNQKYSLTKEQVSLKKTNEEKGDLILEKIIDDIEIFKQPTQAKNKNQFLKDLAFGFDNENIVQCPIIVQNKYTTSTQQDLKQDGTVSENFFKEISTPAFSITCNKTSEPGLKDTKKGNKYFFDKKYFEENIEGIFDNSGFHFETFISFDFNIQKFINNGKDSALFSIPKTEEQINFETFLYSCLNTSLFLTGKQSIENVVVNPEYFKKVFPIAINDNVEANNEYQLMINKYLPSFITNIKYGLRLVCRESIITDGGSKTKINYAQEINAGTPLLDKQTFVEQNKSLIKRPSSYRYALFKTDKDLLGLSFSALEYSIIKNKSYVLFIEKSLKDKKPVYIRRTWIPIVSVYSDDVLNQSSLLPVGINRGTSNESFNIKQLHDFIDDNKNKVLNSLKEKMIKEEKFKLIFENLVPLNVLGTLEKINTAFNSQVFVNLSLAKTPPDSNVIIAKSLKKNISNTIDTLLKTGEY